MHAMMGVDWHGWLFLAGVLAASWMVAVVIAAALFAGSARSAQHGAARTIADDAEGPHSPSSPPRKRRRV